MTVFVSDNDAPYIPWLTNSADTQATFTGQLGHKYLFKVRARDNAFNLESEHALPDAGTSIGTPDLLSVFPLPR